MFLLGVYYFDFFSISLCNEDILIEYNENLYLCNIDASLVEGEEFSLFGQWNTLTNIRKVNNVFGVKISYLKF